MRVRVVDDQPVGDKVVVFLDRQIVGVLHAAGFDAFDRVPVNVGLGRLLQTAGTEKRGQFGDRRAAEAPLFGGTTSDEFLHAHAGLLIQVAPGQAGLAALFVNPWADLAGHGIFAGQSRRDLQKVRAELADLLGAADHLGNDAIEKRPGRIGADEVYRIARRFDSRPLYL